MITFWGGLGDGLACGEDIQVRNLHCHFSLPVIPRFNPDWMVLGGQGSPDCAGCGRSPQQAGSLSRGCSSRTSPKEAPRTEAPDRRWRAHHPPSAQKQLCGVTNSLIRPEWRPIPGKIAHKSGSKAAGIPELREDNQRRGRGRKKKKIELCARALYSVKVATRRK